MNNTYEITNKVKYEFEEKLQADYVEMINEKLDRLSLNTVTDFESIEKALGILLKYNMARAEDDELRSRLEDIVEILNSPELYVADEKKYADFKKLIRNRIAKKVHEIQNLSKKEKNQAIANQQEQKATTQDNQAILKSASPPSPDKCTLSEEEWLAEQQAIFNNRVLTIAQALEIVQQDGLALQSMSSDLQNNRFVVLNAIDQNGLALQYASPELRKERDLVRVAVHQNGLALEYADDLWKNDLKTVIKAMLQNPMAFQYASLTHRSDSELVFAAAYREPATLAYAHEDLQNDRNFILKLAQSIGLVLQYALEKMRKDSEIVLAAVKQNGLALEHASKELQNDRDIVLAAIKQNGMALQYASKELQNDLEIVLAATLQNRLAFQFADHQLRTDRASFLFIQKALADKERSSMTQFSS
jgi:lambda repressor-like predicted transcriptional regulator